MADKQNPLQWDDEDWKRRERLGRYRTAAERSFHRALTALEARRKSRVAEGERAERLQQAAQRIELGHLRRLDAQKQAEEKAEKEVKAAAVKKSKPVSAGRKKKEVFGVAEQWVEVRVTEGATSTWYVPTNEDLLEEIEDAVERGEGEPEMVYRRMNFPDGVPPEYAWTNLHDPQTCEKTLAGGWCPLCSVHTVGGHGMQRMTYATWKEVIEREAAVPGGHAGPTGVGNLPRPKERGGDVSLEEMMEDRVRP